MTYGRNVQRASYLIYVCLLLCNLHVPCAAAAAVPATSQSVDALGFVRFVESGDVGDYGISRLSASSDGLKVAAVFSTKQGPLVGLLDLRSSKASSRRVPLSPVAACFVDEGKNLAIIGGAQNSLQMLDVATFEPKNGDSGALPGSLSGIPARLDVLAVIDGHTDDIAVIRPLENKSATLAQSRHGLDGPFRICTVGNRLVVAGWDDGADNATWKTSLYSLPDLKLIGSFSCILGTTIESRPLRPRVIGRGVVAILREKGVWSAVSLESGHILRDLGADARVAGHPPSDLFFGPDLIQNFELLPTPEDFVWFTSPSKVEEHKSIAHVSVATAVTDIDISKMPITLASLARNNGKLALNCGFWPEDPAGADAMHFVGADVGTREVGEMKEMAGMSSDQWLIVGDKVVHGTPEGLTVRSIDER